MESKFLNQEAYNLLKNKKVQESNQELQKSLQNVIEAIAEERQDFYSVMTELLNDNRGMKQELRAISHLQIKQGLTEQKLQEVQSSYLNLQRQVNTMSTRLGAFALGVVGVLTWVIIRLI